MAALGLVLLALSGVFTVGVVLSNTDATSAAAFGVTLSNVTVGGLFLAGVAAGLTLALGLGLFLVGVNRHRRHRLETRRVARGARNEREQLSAENESLRAQLSDSSSEPETIAVDSGRRSRR